MEVQIVSAYKRLLANISQLIDISGYRQDYIANKMDLKPQNFSTKKQHAKWSMNEIEKLLTIIHNEEVENFLMLEEMRNRKDDETISYNEYKKIISVRK